MLAELGIVQAVACLVAGVLVYLLTSATGGTLAASIALWSWGVVSGLALLAAWRQGVRARASRLRMLQLAEQEGLIG